MSILREAGRLAIMAAIPLARISDGTEASRPDSTTPVPAEAKAVQERTCPIATLPEALPAIGTVVDTDALHRALAAELAQAPASGRMLFSIRFKADGQREWVESIGGDAAAEQLRSRVARLIAEHTKSQPAGDPWSLRLQVVPGEPAQLHLSHSRVCPVELERPVVGVGSPANLSPADTEALQRTGPVRVAVEVSATGTVLSADFLQRSGSRVLDDNVLSAARANRYRPAVVDGVPVAGRYVFEWRPVVRRN